MPRDEVKDRYFRCYLSAMVVYISSFIFKTTIELFYHIVLHGANKVDRSCYQNFICIFAKERLLCSCSLDDNIILQNSLYCTNTILTSCCIAFDFVVGRTQYIINRVSQVDWLVLSFFKII